MGPHLPATGAVRRSLTWRRAATYAGVVGLLTVAGVALPVTPAHAAPPTVTIDQAATQADPSADTPISFTVVFSEPVTDFTGADVLLSGTAAGSLVASVSGAGAVYAVEVSGMTAPGTVSASIPAGAALNGGDEPSEASTSTDNTVTWNAVAPTVTINQAAAEPTSAAPIVFDVVFSAPVAGFAAADVSLSGTAGGSLVAGVSGSGAAYTVEVSGMTTAGTVIATIPAGVAASTAGAVNLASTSSDNTVTWSGPAEATSTPDVTPSAEVMRTPRATITRATLPATGYPLTRLAAVAALLIVAGTATLLLTRRRRSDLAS